MSRIRQGGSGANRAAHPTPMATKANQMSVNPHGMSEIGTPSTVIGGDIAMTHRSAARGMSANDASSDAAAQLTSAGMPTRTKLISHAHTSAIGHATIRQVTCRALQISAADPTRRAA